MKRIKTFQKFLLIDTSVLMDIQLEHGIDVSAELDKICEIETKEAKPFNFTPSQFEIPETPAVEFDYTKVTDWCQIPF